MSILHTVCPGSIDPFYVVLYGQEVVTFQKKYLIYLHQKIRLTITILRLNIIRLQSKIILGHMNSIGWNSSIQYFRLGHYFLDTQYKHEKSLMYYFLYMPTPPVIQLKTCFP